MDSMIKFIERLLKIKFTELNSKNERNLFYDVRMNYSNEHITIDFHFTHNIVDLEILNKVRNCCMNSFIDVYFINLQDKRLTVYYKPE